MWVGFILLGGIKVVSFLGKGKGKAEDLTGGVWGGRRAEVRPGKGMGGPHYRDRPAGCY